MSYKLSGLLVASALFCFPAALHAGQSPVITTQPQSQPAIAGSSVTFTVAATGTTPLGFQWKFNGANLSGATNLTLRLDNVQPVQAGTYSVRVSNPYGSAQSSGAQLTVNVRSEEHTSELQSRLHLVCRLLLEKKKKNN